jgi:GntR family transcriptional regulator
MIIQIEHNAPEPIYEQLIAEIQRMIETGQLAENDSLPSIRQLASQLDVAINTVARAYQELERKGLVIGNGRKGTFVKRQITSPSQTRELKDIIIAMIRQGHDRKDIERVFNSHLDQIFN